VRKLQRKLWASAKQSPDRRFHALYDRIVRDDILEEAWKRVRRNQGAAGVDKQTIAAVEAYGVKRNRFADREIVARAGSTVFVPAGVPHTFGNAGPEPSRFLIIMPAHLAELVSKLHQVDPSDRAARWKQYDSELLEP
jgi:hypothetical protein